MRFQTVLAVSLIAGLMFGGAGFMAGSTTGGLFTDAETTDGSIQAAESFATTPPNACAYDDVIGDGIWNQWEPTYDEGELYSFDNESVSLVIPEDCGWIANYEDIENSAGSITSETGFLATQSTSISASEGPIDIEDQQILAFGKVSLSASGPVNMDGSTVSSWFGGIFNPSGIDISGDSISTVDAEMGANVSEIQLTATGGKIDGTRMSLTTSHSNSPNDIILDSNGDMGLDEAILNASGDITADLTSSDNTLFVDKASVNDSDLTLVYIPPNVNVDGKLRSGYLTNESTTLAMTTSHVTSARSATISRQDLFPEETTD